MQDDAAVLKAKEALEAGRVADEKLLAQDAKRQEMTRLQKEEAEGLKKQQEQAKQQTEKAKKTDDADSDDKSKKPKRLRNTSGADGRKQLHVAKKNPSRKLKKKDRTRLSQKIQEEQAQHGFQKPIEKVVHEVSIPSFLDAWHLVLIIFHLLHDQPLKPLLLSILPHHLAWAL
jgi:translation initiation factor IF-2